MVCMGRTRGVNDRPVFGKKDQTPKWDLDRLFFHLFCGHLWRPTLGAEIAVPSGNNEVSALLLQVLTFSHGWLEQGFCL